MTTGLDHIADGFVPELRGKRLAVLCNHTAIDRWGRHIVKVLEGVGATVVRALAPEHGLWGTHQDMEPVLVGDGAVDPILGVPVVSLYGAELASLTPPVEALSGVDALVFDIQDIGSRYYTYAATLALAMKVAAPLGLPVYVCDRPNPIGHRREGPLLRAGFESFCGLVPGLPIRHGLTVGALARFYRAAVAPDADLRVIASRPGGRAPWVPPSPNMPTVTTALAYPGLCLLEGTTLSEGRGTTSPFLQLGAPDLDNLAAIQDLRRRDCPGVDFIATSFRPAFGKHAGQLCRGIYLHVFDPNALHAVRLGVHVLDACRRASPEAWTWRADAYEFVEDVPAIDLLWGSAELRETLERGEAVDRLLDAADADCARFDPRPYEQH
jgi:uncharacterized protein YbbC (DUF1343 family)